MLYVYQYTSFLFMAECWIICICQNSSLDRHLGCFHHLVTGNNVAMNMLVHICAEAPVINSICLGVELVGNTGMLCSAFRGIAKLHPTVDEPSCIATSNPNVRGFYFLHIVVIFCDLSLPPSPFYRM